MKEIKSNLCEKQNSSCWYLAILNSVNDAVYIVNLKRQIVFFNRAAEKVTGYSAKEAIGRQCFKIFRSDICDTECPLLRSIETRKPIYEHLGKIVNRRGRQIAASSSIAPMRDQNGKLMGVVVIFRDLSEIEALRSIIRKSYSCGEIISKNPFMQDIFQQLPDIAESDCSVLLQGATGTGKGLFANTIHELSARKENPFIKINCAAIPETLLEAELFGYAKGAFTDAKKDKPGKFLLSDGGTLFLDEVGDTSPAIQAKFLKVLDDKEIFPLGGIKSVKVDVRIIAASNKKLTDLVQTGAFREDLFYRLNVMQISLPCLCDRKEDIPMLIEDFVSKFRFVKGKSIIGVSEEVLGYLMNYSFPGNARELQNIIEHACVLCKGQIIETKHLPMDLIRKIEKSCMPPTRNGSLIRSEIQNIRETLEMHSGNRETAARELGISRSTLWRRMKEYKLN